MKGQEGVVSISDKDFVDSLLKRKLSRSDREQLLNFKEVRRWIRRASPTGSPMTINKYLKHLWAFIQFASRRLNRELTPKDMIELAKSDEEWLQEFSDLLEEFFSIIDEIRARNTAYNYFTAVRSFFSHNRVRLDVTNKEQYTVRASASLEKDEISSMLGVARHPLERAIILFLAQTGQRVGILTALRVRHLRKALEDEKVQYHVVEVEGGLRDFKGNLVVKERASYSFCVGPEALDALRSYFKWRKDVFNDIGDERPLFVAKKRFRKDVPPPPIDNQTVSEIVRDLVRMAGIDKNKRVTPHSFRKFFQNQLAVAGVNQLYIDYMMGHRIDNTRRAYFRANILNVYRDAYEYLSVTRPTSDYMKMKLIAQLEALKVQAEQHGIDLEKLMEEIRRELGREPTLPEIVGGLRRKITEAVKEREGYTYKIVSIEELEGLLNSGWELVRPLNENKALVRMKKGLAKV